MRFPTCFFVVRSCFLLLTTTLVVQGSSSSSSSRMMTFENLSPVPNLPLGDVNIVVVTDVHSWVGGHGEIPTNGDTTIQSANYGDVLSFVQRLKQYGEENGQDFWFVMNGDWIDGTGLAMNGDASYLIPILEKMNFDAVGVGNHELYKSDVVNYMTRTAGFTEFLGKRYLSSNVVFSGTKKHIGHPLNILQGKNSNVLVFGFLYNMIGASTVVTVQTVQSVMTEKWFVNAVKDTKAYDSVLVLAHMDANDELCTLILQRIRKLTGSSNLPVHFLTGHTHRREYQSLDAYSSSFEAGHYLDTVGFLSYPSLKHHAVNTQKQAALDIAQSLNVTRDEEQSAEATTTAQHVFIHGTVPALEQALNLPPQSLRTTDGEDLSNFIQQIQIELGLESVIGWACETYLLNKSLSAHDSLWGHFQREVVPSRFETNHMIVLGNPAWRNDAIQKGEIRFDDAIGISPFNNSLFMYENVPNGVIQKLETFLNDGNQTKKSYNPLPNIPMFVFSPADLKQQHENYHLVVDSFEALEIERALEQVWEEELPKPIRMRETTTSIWIDYFQENHVDYCKARGKPPPSKYVPTTVFNTNATEDTLHMVFVAFALVAVFALGTVYVWQRSVIFEQWSEAKEFATIEALQEYEEEHWEDDDYDRSEEYGSEGLFV